METKSILVGGTGRCGTKILRTAIAAHPKIASYPAEPRFSIDPNGPIHFYISVKYGWSPYLYDVQLKCLIKFLRKFSKKSFPLNFYNSLGIRKLGNRNISPAYIGRDMSKFCDKYDQIVNKLEKDLLKFSYQGRWSGTKLFEKCTISFFPYEIETIAEILRNFLYQIYYCVAKFQNADIYLEDNTWNILYFDHILELVPSTKLIHIFRDPRDVICSFLSQKWTPNSIEENIQYYKSLMNRWKKVKSNLDKDSYREVSFENFITNTDDVMEELYAFIDLECNTNYKYLDLSHSNIGSYKQKLKSYEINQIELELESEILEYGGNTINDF